LFMQAPRPPPGAILSWSMRVKNTSALCFLVLNPPASKLFKFSGSMWGEPLEKSATWICLTCSSRLSPTVFRPEKEIVSSKPQKGNCRRAKCASGQRCAKLIASTYASLDRRPDSLPGMRQLQSQTFFPSHNIGNRTEPDLHSTVSMSRVSTPILVDSNRLRASFSESQVNPLSSKMDRTSDVT
jgi:hypothetical protein